MGWMRRGAMWGATLIALPGVVYAWHHVAVTGGPEFLVLDPGKHVFHVVVLPVIAYVMLRSPPTAALASLKRTRDTADPVRRTGIWWTAVVLLAALPTIAGVAVSMSTIEVVAKVGDNRALPYPTDFAASWKSVDDVKTLADAATKDLQTLSGRAAWIPKLETSGPHDFMVSLDMALRGLVGQVTPIPVDPNLASVPTLAPKARAAYRTSADRVCAELSGTAAFGEVTGQWGKLGLLLSVLGVAIGLVVVWHVMLLGLVTSYEAYLSRLDRELGTNWQGFDCGPSALRALVLVGLASCWIPMRTLSAIQLGYGDITAMTEAPFAGGFVLVVTVVVAIAAWAQIREAPWIVRLAVVIVPAGSFLWTLAISVPKFKDYLPPVSIPVQAGLYVFGAIAVYVLVLMIQFSESYPDEGEASRKPLELTDETTTSEIEKPTEPFGLGPAPDAGSVGE